MGEGKAREVVESIKSRRGRASAGEIGSEEREIGRREVSESVIESVRGDEGEEEQSVGICAGATVQRLELWMVSLRLAVDWLTYDGDKDGRKAVIQQKPRSRGHNG